MEETREFILAIMDERHHSRELETILLAEIDKELHAQLIIPVDSSGRLDWVQVFKCSKVMKTLEPAIERCKGYNEPSFMSRPSKILLLWRNMIAHCLLKPGSSLSRLEQIDDVFKSAFPHLLPVVHYFCMQLGVLSIERAHDNKMTFTSSSKKVDPSPLCLPCAAPPAVVDLELSAKFLTDEFGDELLQLFACHPALVSKLCDYWNSTRLCFALALKN